MESRFAIEFEKTYLRWLYEVLDFVENRQTQAPLDGAGHTSTVEEPAAVNDAINEFLGSP